LKAICSDNETEFRNTSFDQFYLKHGVDQQFSTPPIPQQNGVMEQKNHILVKMARTMLDEHRTPTRFWANAISIACYISNRICRCKPSISHLSPFDCKCFVLKHGSLDKFESCSSNGILLGYTPHGRCYRGFNFETNTVVESYDVTFDETAPCPHDVFECTSDKEMEETLFIDEELHGFDGDEDESLHPSTSSPELVPASTVEAEASQATTSTTVAVEASLVEGEIISQQGALSHVQKAHPRQQIIGN
jgi:hypothetical protein